MIDPKNVRTVATILADRSALSAPVRRRLATVLGMILERDDPRSVERSVEFVEWFTSSRWKYPDAAFRQAEDEFELFFSERTSGSRPFRKCSGCGLVSVPYYGSECVVCSTAVPDEIEERTDDT